MIMNISHPLISIVAPVYNVVNYLPSFIESIIQQTYKNWELILVDDGSADGSGLICDEYAQKDSRITVIHNQNEGVSCARNKGIKTAKGEWLLLPDADDIIIHDALDTLLSFTNDDIDLVSASYKRFVLGKLVLERRPAETKKFAVDEYVEEIGKLSGIRNIDRYCWNKLFRMSIIKEKDIRFDEDISYREDILFVYQYLMRCTHYIQCSSYIMYEYYRRRTGAAISLQTAYSPKSSGKFYAMIRCYDILEQIHVSDRVKKRMKREIFRAYNEISLLIGNETIWKNEKDDITKVFYNYLSLRERFLLYGRELYRKVKSQLKHII